MSESVNQEELAASPESLAEARRLLADAPDLRPVAGGTDLMVADPVERADLTRVIDVGRIAELHGIAETADGSVEIGAAVSFDEIRRHPLVTERHPALAAAAAEVGGWQIQTRATLGGNMANASPAGDSLPVLLALGATVVVDGAHGEREVAYDDFHVGYRETALRPGELIVRVRLPAAAGADRPGVRQLFRKVGTREAQAISKLVVALSARLESGAVASVRFAAGSVAATPVRLVAAEEAVADRRPDEETAAAAGEAAAGSVTPIDDVRSTADYRRAVLARVVRRLVLSLAESSQETPS
ncbi:MAG TPA: xanthine dehydrogenase family protein subunit M [Thermoanaerobaculia bacterium]|nr:xanthine dehydrogenase family protein subunit M [Thermoanaerobaculia bacterium]